MYTPVPAITDGAHFYSLDTMHMVEAMLLYDHATESSDSNFVHPAARHTFRLMINGIKHNPRNGMSSSTSICNLSLTRSLSVYCKKSLMALCRLVLNEEDYFRDPVEDPDLTRQWYHMVQPGVTRKLAEKRLPLMQEHALAIDNATKLLEALQGDEESPYADKVLGAGFYEPGEDVDITEFRDLLQ